MIARANAVVAVWIVSAAATFAQAPVLPAEPETPARVWLGPVAVRPTVTLREVGYDSNVLHAPEASRGDITATFGGRAETSVRARGLRATSTTFYEYRYFEALESERGSNRGTEGHVDLSLGRLQPYLAAGLITSRERPTAEIDARARRVESRATAGLFAPVLSRTVLHLGVERRSAAYADGEVFAGVGLADQLNGTSSAVRYGAGVQLSPFTNVAVHGERARDRFQRSPLRDADSHRYGITATLHPHALVSGRATVGVRAFRPLSRNLDAFTGVTAAVAVGYTYRDRAAVALEVDRDVRYSFDERTPWYLSTGARVTFTHRLFGRFEGQASTGVERLRYEPRLDTPRQHHRRDRIALAGAGLRMRLAGGARLGLHVDHTTRSSAIAGRAYARGRLYATMAYGF